MAETTTTNDTGIARALIGGLVATALIVGVIVLLLRRLNLQDDVLRLLQWLDAQPLWAPILFVLIMAAVVILLLPGIFFTTGAGFVFGLLQGTVYVVVGTTLGAAVAFLIARHLLSERAKRYVLRNPKLSRLDAALSPHAWKLVLFTRLVPFFPGKLSNYFFGLTSMSLRSFVLGTGLGIIPFSIHNVYLGAIAAELATGGARSGGLSPTEWALYGGGLLIAAGGAIYLARIAHRALNETADVG